MDEGTHSLDMNMEKSKDFDEDVDECWSVLSMSLRSV